MSAPESRDRSNDYGHLILGVLLTLIGATFFTTRVAGAQERLFTGACLIAGVAMLATSPKYMWRFSSVCTSIMIFGAMWILYGVLVFLMGESGGLATHQVAHTSGIYPLIAGAIIAMIGFVLRIVYSVFHP
jgi:hypothetical protein